MKKHLVVVNFIRCFSHSETSSTFRVFPKNQLSAQSDIEPWLAFDSVAAYGTFLVVYQALRSSTNHLNQVEQLSLAYSGVLRTIDEIRFYTDYGGVDWQTEKVANEPYEALYERRQEIVPKWRNGTQLVLPLRDKSLTDWMTISNPHQS